MMCSYWDSTIDIFAVTGRIQELLHFIPGAQQRLHQYGVQEHLELLLPLDQELPLCAPKHLLGREG